MIKSYRLLFILLISLSFSSCDHGSLLPGTSGSPYEVLVVMDNHLWKSEAGESLFSLLNSNTPGITQNESLFNISRTESKYFDETIRIARNIIIVDISDKYTKSKVTYQTDIWASPQVIVKISAPNNEKFINTLNKFNKNICEFIVSAERKRQENYYKKYYNEKTSKQVSDMFGVELKIPSQMKKSKLGNDFFWASNMSLEARQDIIVYSYPYTHKNTFTKEYLLQKRDSILKVHIPGPSKNSYMQTEYRLDPTFEEILKNDRYCAEIRGWWRVEGDLMGGPFISHTQLDEKNQRVVTIEAFVYAPGQNKRSFIRQLEAVVYSLKLPQDIIEKK